ncbi:MAG: right-handed parallel beta-helix repeat-containing protein [Fimbriimonadaceae bacterium]
MHLRLVPCAIMVWLASQPSVGSAAPDSGGHPISRYYYISPEGNDSDTGQTLTHAWRTLSKVNETTLKPGDRVVLQSGVEFKGNLALNATEAGTPSNPIVICSSGRERATIVSPEHPAISAAAGGIEIRDLVLKGEATQKAKGHYGIALMASGADGEKYRHVRIQNVDVSEFGDAGVAIGSLNATRTGFEDVRITHVAAHHNFGNGITTWDDAGDRARGYAHKNVYVGDCDVSENLAGSGLVISGVDGGLVEYCRASGNAGPHGGVGIWAYTTRNVKFQFCIAEGTRSAGGDGGGFDLDGGCVDCAVENCLAYENAGPGYMHCDYPGAPPTFGNVMRHCISINDGRKEKGDNIGFGFVTWGSGLDKCNIVDNLAVVTDGDPHKRGEAAFFVTYILGSQAAMDKPHVQGCCFRDNLALISGAGVAFVGVAAQVQTPSDVLFEGNWYAADGGAAPDFGHGTTRYATLDEWRAATGQETKDGASTARTDRPRLQPIDRKDYRLAEPRRLPGFFLMKFLKK